MRYHMHREAQFRGGDFDERGSLQRRHVVVLAVQPIGKEADNLEERNQIDAADGSLEHSLSARDRNRLIGVIQKGRSKLGMRRLAAAARVSHHTIRAILDGHGSSDRALIRLATVAEALLGELQRHEGAVVDLLAFANQRVREIGRSALARQLVVYARYLGRVLSGARSPSEALVEKLRALATPRKG